MKITFGVLTAYQRPGIHLWKILDQDIPFKFLHPRSGPDNGWWRFEAELDEPVSSLGFKLFLWNDGNTKPQLWESPGLLFNRVIRLTPGETLPERIWLIHGSNRVILTDPTTETITRLRVHLITKNAFRQGRLYLWLPDQPAATVERTGSDQHGPYFDLDLTGEFRHAFNFKFIDNEEGEPDYANRTWVSADGTEIWTHSNGPAILKKAPELKQLTVHFCHEWGNIPVKMRLEQESSNFAVEIDGAAESDGWSVFQTKKELYTGLPYAFKFFKPGWEMAEADPIRRIRQLNADEECWVLEGSNFQFATRPKRDQPVMVEIIAQAPECSFNHPDWLYVKVDHARADLQPQFEPQPDGTWRFWTYPKVTTVFRFGAAGQVEPCQHRLQPSPAVAKVYVILGRAPCLFERPPLKLCAAPPYTIKRPGVVAEDGYLRFAVHARWCSRVRLRGEWQTTGPVDLQATPDGAYWWLQIPITAITNSLGGRDYHGAWYQYLFNDTFGGAANTVLNQAKTVQDPAADWITATHPTEGRSQLVNHSNYTWQSASWRTPGWEYLTVYELHPARFTQRNGLAPFAEVAREVESGYLRDLGITAILLMPANEFPWRGWGYNPSYYYAVKAAYGGADELKRLVDVCHQQGIAVLLDVVFNHAGFSDNILWVVDQDTYFDGQTRWGSMINFSDPWCKEFFAQCLVSWSYHYHLDGFRFDMTNPIIEGHTWAPFVNEPNSDNRGWEFLHYLRNILKDADRQCLMMAEQLPNNWGLTNYGGPMDTQWQDDFHDRLIDVCRGDFSQMGHLADALKLSGTVCHQWYNATIYPSSHDEVGNVNDRIANVAGYGRGLRINKVAAVVTLLGRGIPMFFMGEESGEAGQFAQDSDADLDLTNYETDLNRRRVRAWWQTLLNLRRGNPRIQGPAPLAVHYVEGPALAFSRGEYHDYFVVINFGDAELTRKLKILNLPGGTYREVWNSTYPDFQVEWENEYRNWGNLERDQILHIPDNGAVILERTR
jgi:1,4-alpha-glucan branching enzyme